MCIRDRFTVVRQNRVANQVLFDAFNADFTMVPSCIVARECLALINSPLLPRLLNLVRDWPDSRAAAVARELEDLCQRRVPMVWGVRLNAAEAPAAHRFLMMEEGSMALDLLPVSYTHLDVYKRQGQTGTADELLPRLLLRQLYGQHDRLRRAAEPLFRSAADVGHGVHLPVCLLYTSRCV